MALGHMDERDRFYVGMAAVAVISVQSVDPVTGEKAPPDPPPSSVTIRFLNPDQTELANNTLADGVVDAGEADNGHYYHAFAVPTEEGRHYVEAETGGAKPGRTKFGFTVEPF
jgi:hypothetical protein